MMRSVNSLPIVLLLAGLVTLTGCESSSERARLEKAPVREVDETPVVASDPHDAGGAPHVHSAEEGPDAHGHAPAEGADPHGHAAQKGADPHGHTPADGSDPHAAHREARPGQAGVVEVEAHTARGSVQLPAPTTSATPGR